jgi:hypothetical protein
MYEKFCVSLNETNLLLIEINIDIEKKNIHIKEHKTKDCTIKPIIIYAPPADVGLNGIPLFGTAASFIIILMMLIKFASINTTEEQIKFCLGL